MFYFKVIIECAFDSLLSSSSHWQSLNAKWQLCNCGNLQQSCNYDLLFPLNHVQPQPAGHERCVRCILRAPQHLEVLWLHDKVTGGLLGLIYRGNVKEEAFGMLHGTAVACSDNPQINHYQLDRRIHKWPIFFEKATNRYRVSLTNQSNEWIELNTAPTVCSLNLDTELGANFPWCMLHEC